MSITAPPLPPKDPMTPTSPAPEAVALNEIAHVTIQTADELPVEPYAARGAVGNFLLIDQSSGNTLAAGFVGHRLR